MISMVAGRDRGGVCQTFSAKLRVTEKSSKGSDSSCPGMPAIAAATVSCMQQLTGPQEVV